MGWKVSGKLHVVWIRRRTLLIGHVLSSTVLLFDSAEIASQERRQQGKSQWKRLEFLQTLPKGVRPFAMDEINEAESSAFGSWKMRRRIGKRQSRDDERVNHLFSEPSSTFIENALRRKMQFSQTKACCPTMNESCRLNTTFQTSSDGGNCHSKNRVDWLFKAPFVLRFQIRTDYLFEFFRFFALCSRLRFRGNFPGAIIEFRRIFLAK